MPVEILLLRSYRLACTVGNRSLPLPDLENKREIMPTKSTTKKCVMAILRNPAWVCLIWFGMTAGVSLLATPVRFTATTLTRPVALDVGRVVFAALNKAEFVCADYLVGRGSPDWKSERTLGLLRHFDADPDSSVHLVVARAGRPHRPHYCGYRAGTINCPRRLFDT